ncbi:MAG: histidine phosphatase family protein [Caulobacteraceae bacterium]|nr:histidine phosphatase family protein [Caulobacteraceae bacterium]
MTTDSLPEVRSNRTPAQTTAAGAVVAVRPGSITLTRHGEPALSRKILLTAQGYREWWARYELGGLLEGQVPPPCLVEHAAQVGAIYCSTRQRARETAAALDPDGRAVPDDVFIEAPLPPPNAPDWFRLSPRWWGVVARAWWWFFDHNEGQETKAEAEVRAARAADKLEAEAAQGRDVLVLAHGFFNGMVGVELARRGWRCTRDKGFKYWSARRFEKA